MSTSLSATQIGDCSFLWGERTYVMGILNATPDSFSGDGLGADVNAAVVRARTFATDGADLIDVGGESTRPGHTPVSVDEELRRTIPVVEAITGSVVVPLSIDTSKREVAEAALAAGAAMINDEWGLKRGSRLGEAAAATGAAMVLMHNQEDTAYRDLVPEVVESLARSVDEAVSAGVSRGRIIVDPGIGFGKTAEQNLELLRRLGELRPLGLPILVGVSRKSTIGAVLGLPVDQRLEGTAATVAVAIANGADIVRVHDVKEMVRVVRMTDAIVRGWTPA
jgi:dihydropteroate synthase